MFQEAASKIGWQRRRISQLQEELRTQAKFQEDLEGKRQARPSAVLPTSGMDAILEAMAWAQQDREHEASRHFW